MGNRLHRFYSSHRLLWMLAAALVAAALLYPRPDRHTGGAADVEEIVFWTPVGGVSDALRVAVEEFERRHPNYRVRMGAATVRDATGDPTRFLLGVAGGVPPDLIYFDRFAVVEWASRGAFEDLTGRLQADRTRSDGVHPEDYLKPAWNEAVYHGGVYAIPNSVDTRGMYYHRNDLVRAGFVYRADDPEVRRGAATAGQARPPRTWEELCRKRMHARGRVSAEGTVRLERWVRRSGVNEHRPPDSSPDVAAAGVRSGDVIALVAAGDVFRGRVAKVLATDTVRIDLEREQPPDLKAVAHPFVAERCEIKIYDQESYLCRLTRHDPRSGALTKVGFLPLFGNSYLCMYSWLNGARFMTADGAACRLDSLEIVEALQFLTDMYDALGGVRKANAFRTAAGSGALDPWLSGAITMRFDSNGLIGMVSLYRPDLSFGACGAPIPQKRLAAGHRPVGWMGGWSYAIPSTAKRKDAAWELLRWLCSPQANDLMARFTASQARSRGQMYFPALHPNRRIMESLRRQYIDENPTVTPDMRQAYNAFIDLLPTSKHRPVTPVGQRLWSEHIRATDAALNHVKPPYEALNYGSRRIQTALERSLNPPSGPRVPWGRLIALYVLCVAVFFAALIGAQEWRRRKAGLKSRRWLQGYLCASPWLVGFVVFGAGPIFFSLIISFCHYDVLSPARFIGWSNYVNLLGSHHDPVVGRRVANDPLFWRSLANTGFMILGVPVGIIAGLGLALLLNAKVRGLHVFRTLYYLPAIVPAVAGFVLWLWIFDPVRGLLNQALRMAGVGTPPLWLQDPLWAKPAMIIMGLWGVGGGMIIWLAGLKEIPESLYEAARIDGAGPWQRFRHVTLPLLTPYIFFHSIMGMIGVFQVFGAAYIMTQGGPADSTLFYALKLFNEAFRYLNMGAASAMAWILFLVVLAVTLVQLWLGKKWVHYER